MAEKSKLPIKAKPYAHQIKAFDFVCRLFGLANGGDDKNIFKSNGANLLMEMG